MLHAAAAAAAADDDDDDDDDDDYVTWQVVSEQQYVNGRSRCDIMRIMTVKMMMMMVVVVVMMLLLLLMMISTRTIEKEEQPMQPHVSLRHRWQRLLFHNWTFAA